MTLSRLAHLRVTLAVRRLVRTIKSKGDKVMKKSIGSVFLAFVFLTVLLSGCAPASTPVPPTSVGEKPVAGGVQGNNDPQTFKLLLIVFNDNSGVIDYVELACAPQGTISGFPVTVAKDVKVAGGQFRAEDNDVVIQGQFISSTEVEGTIHALTDDARSCGVPDEGKWTAKCDLVATKSGEGYTIEKAKSGPCAAP